MKMIKKILSLLVVTVLASCGTSQQVTEHTATTGVETPVVREATILAVNDMHANIDDFPKLAYIVDELRAQHPDMLLVSAGDYQTGNPMNDQYEEKGRPIIELMNVLKFDLTAVGNHEFDLGIESFEKHTKLANFEHISANMSWPKNRNLNVKPYKTLTLANGLKLAFVSVIDLNERMQPDAHPDRLSEFKFTDPYTTAQQYLHLADESDVLIYMTHLGFENDVKLANSFPTGVVDLIIGGHSHTKVDTEQIHNDVLITQAQNRLKYATLIRLKVYADGSIERAMELLPVAASKNEQSAMKSLVDKYNQNPYMMEVLAKAPNDFRTREEIAYWMADAMKTTAQTDIAIINRGGVRIDELAAGDITRKTLFSIDPFGNSLATVNMTGHELQRFISNMFSQDDYRFMYPAGLRLKYTTADNNSKLVNLELFNEDGTPLDMDKTYRVATSSYVLSVVKYDRKDPGQSLTITSTEGWIDWLLDGAEVKDYQTVKRTYVNE
ncbi:MAG: bifunctional UDP-sugar hydrolase/5'-nucleotidase [Alcaligenaceae bacterium]|nr:bifunctional UDP-sugar hydrolase/5'-nucleotidase [Alcaligenaceae bacterium]